MANDPQLQIQEFEASGGNPFSRPIRPMQKMLPGLTVVTLPCMARVLGQRRPLSRVEDMLTSGGTAADQWLPIGFPQSRWDLGDVRVGPRWHAVSS